MDIERLSGALKKRMSVLCKERFRKTEPLPEISEIAELDRAIERVRTIQGRLTHYRKILHRNELIARSRRQIMLSRETAMDKSKTIIAIDTGADPLTEKLNSVGISVLMSGEHGIVGTRDLIPDYCGSSVLDERFQHGTSEVMSIDEIRRTVQDAITLADVLVGYSFRFDAERLATIGVKVNKPYASIERWVTKGHDTPPLEIACAEHGIDHAQSHNSGNDANATMRLFLELIKP